MLDLRKLTSNHKITLGDLVIFTASLQETIEFYFVSKIFPMKFSHNKGKLHKRANTKRNIINPAGKS